MKILDWIPWKKVRLYCTIFILIHFVVVSHDMSFWVSISLLLILVVIENLSEYSSKFIALLYVHKKYLNVIICILCVIFASYACRRYGYPKPQIPLNKNSNVDVLNEVFKFSLTGFVLGIISRVLLIHYISQSFLGKKTTSPRYMLMADYLVMLWLCPYAQSQYICVYSVGFGIGFTAHYLYRTIEKKDAQYQRLKENLKSNIESNNHHSNELSHNHQVALQLYASQKWGLLDRHLENIPEDDVIFFIKISMLRIQHKYLEILALIQQKEDRKPEWYSKNEHFFILHKALNSYETKDYDQLLDENINLIRQAIQINPNCLLSLSTISLRLADKIDNIVDDYERTACQQESFQKIWDALRIYEMSDKHFDPISLVTGTVVPLTYSFLLESYSYVLLKNGYFKFSRSLFNHCLSREPSFSSTYLHFAQWHIDCYEKKQNQTINWKRVAEINLYIALEIENLFKKKNHSSFISYKAHNLLQKLKTIS